MELIHNSRLKIFREPFGAIKLGQNVTMRIAADFGAFESCRLRTWVDGRGESFIEMNKEEGPDGTFFSCCAEFDEPAIVWYHFVLRCYDGRTLWYGAREGKVGGEGAAYDHEPASFQLTVYRERKVPDWYLSAVLYQIFPDTYARDAGYKERAACLSEKRNGPERVLVEPWETKPHYDKDERGNITRWSFHGGSLKGICEKLPHLKELGITAIYLNPIFEAASWHRYDTADYMKIDPLLGSEEDFAQLCKEAEKQGIRIILDGVFNHTGCDSKYFDRYGNYGGTGAYNNPESEYRAWFNFNDSPCGYDAWWGVADLPAINENDPAYREYINGRAGVVRKWLRLGASGFRLDVADELPDDFIAELKTAMLEEKKDGILIGEVWEDASNKISYGKLRSYFLGTELDGVMNYPFRDAVIGFLLGRISARDTAEIFESLKENYPRGAFYSGFNMLSSHDRPRIVTILGEAPDPAGMSDSEKENYELPADKAGLAKARLWLALLLQMTFPGIPCIYYGDEAGMQGYADPFNRGPFPWGNEDRDMRTMHDGALSLRRFYDVFTDGDFEAIAPSDDVFGHYRRNEKDCFAVLINRNIWESREAVFDLPCDLADRAARGEKLSFTELVSGKEVALDGGKVKVALRPLDSAVIHISLGEAEKAAPFERGTGVLCHITSLPGFAEKGLSAGYDFVDALASARAKYWQMLPINPTDEYGSPYAGTSAFAGNVNLLGMSGEEIEHRFAELKKDKALEKEYKAFKKANEYWLPDYARIVAAENAGKVGCNALSTPEIECFAQFLFEKEWLKLKAYANERGVKLIGDIPMFVSAGSVDAKLWKKYFKLGPDGSVAEQAGVPPDSFSEEGQLWGNPLYDWDALAADDFEWWIRRLGRLFKFFDYVRLDHFRGFESSWCVPSGKAAKEGRWVKAKGKELFEEAFARFGKLPVIAEDLGFITPAVRALMDITGFPGMDIMQFYDGDPLEYEAPKGRIVYTGTHDNDTLVGFCEKRYCAEEPIEAPAEQVEEPAEEKETAEEIAVKLLEKAFGSKADVVIVPLQDLMLLDSSARMNVPGRLGKNWSWQAKEEDMSKAADLLERLIKESERY